MDSDLDPGILHKSSTRVGVETFQTHSSKGTTPPDPQSTRAGDVTGESENPFTTVQVPRIVENYCRSDLDVAEGLQTAAGTQCDCLRRFRKSL
jgi:hypothetical protein